VLIKTLHDDGDLSSRKSESLHIACLPLPEFSTNSSWGKCHPNRVTHPSIQASIRVHGDFHLGQILWTGKDFVLIDFAGEPARSVTYRRLKRPALVDVAGMIRSFHYAAHAAAAPLAEEVASSSDPEVLAPLLSCWYRSVSVVFLSAYLDQAGPVPFVPPAEQLPLLLDFLLLDKAIYELAYEVNSRPTWVDIPAQGILDLLGSEP